MSNFWDVIKQWFDRTLVGKAWQVSSIHNALQRGEVTVHNIRPVGAATYIIQIDDSVDLNNVAAAWEPTLSQRLLSGVSGVPISNIRRHEFADALRLEADVREADSHLLESGLMPPVSMTRVNRKNRQLDGQSFQFSYETLISTLLRAAGLNVADCTELANGGYGTRYLSLSVA